MERASEVPWGLIQRLRTVQNSENEKPSYESERPREDNTKVKLYRRIYRFGPGVGINLSICLAIFCRVNLQHFLCHGFAPKLALEGKTDTETERKEFEQWRMKKGVGGGGSKARKKEATYWAI